MELLRRVSTGDCKSGTEWHCLEGCAGRLRIVNNRASDSGAAGAQPELSSVV